MRIVSKASEFISALEGAKREATAGFGNDLVLLERYVDQPRHVEVQVFADNYGNCVKTDFLRGLAIGLAIVAFLAGIAAFLISYFKNGEINAMPVGIGMIILAAILLATRTKKSIDE